MDGRSLAGMPAPIGGLVSRLSGWRWRAACPVCGSRNLRPLWRIPIAGGDGPLLLPVALACFDACARCGTILANPAKQVPSAPPYNLPDHHAAALARWASGSTDGMVQAGPAALLAGARPLAEAAAHEPGTAAFGCLLSGFATAPRPLALLARLLAALRPKGRALLAMPAHRPGMALDPLRLPPLLAGPLLPDTLQRLLPCEVLEAEMQAGEWLLLLERRAEPITEAHLAVGTPPADAPDLDLRLLAPPFDPYESGSVGLIARIPDLAALADSSSEPRRSPLLLFEDGVRLGPAHSPHVAISKLGGGAFSHWGPDLIFSSSDGSDPNLNGRCYMAALPVARN